MLFTTFAIALLLLAALPAWMVYRNLPWFHRAASGPPTGPCSISILIPARNEATGIADAVNSVLANPDVGIEVIVMDDYSTDRTAEIVADIASRDARVKLARAPKLPQGWNGKQHACWQLAQLATHDWLIFMDADVRLNASALARLAAEQQNTQVALLSGFPKQVTVTLPEKLLVPMMYFVLLGYLPLDQMRSSLKPAFGAGCGQLFFTQRQAYLQAGGHAAIQASRHDGLQLPREYRRHGLTTDVIDASDLASVRMYSDWGSVLNGVQKNATEGIANSKLIVLFSVLLLGASVLPVLSLAHAIFYGWPQSATLVLTLASLLSFVPRALIARQLSQSWLGVLLHPVAVAIFVALQWTAFLREKLGLAAIRWKGRS